MRTHFNSGFLICVLIVAISLVSCCRHQPEPKALPEWLTDEDSGYIEFEQGPISVYFDQDGFTPEQTYQRVGEIVKEMKTAWKLVDSKLLTRVGRDMYERNIRCTFRYLGTFGTYDANLPDEAPTSWGYTVEADNIDDLVKGILALPWEELRTDSIQTSQSGNR